MRNNKFIVLTLLVLSSLFTATASDSSVDYTNDLQLLKEALEKAHPAYQRYASEEELTAAWSILFDAAKSNNLSDLQFYTGVSKFLATLRCDHTKAELPKSLANTKKQRFLPFQFGLFDDQMFVAKSTLTELQRGDEITHINEQPIQEVLAKLRPYMARDGFTDHIADSKLMSDGDLMGSGFEQFFAPVVLKLDVYPSTYTLKVSKRNGTTQILEVDTIDFAQWQALSTLAYRLDFKDAVKLAYTDDQKTAILTVDTFVNYRQPVNAKALFKKIFKDINAKGVQHLIVDLRQNGGGSDDAQLALMKHLYTSPFQLVDGAWVSQHELGSLADKLQSWDRKVIEVNKASLD